MIVITRRRLIACVALLLVSIAGCGQMGPLTIPDQADTEEDESSDEENER